ncbi:hypothetical protein ACFL0Z_02615 [Patescibacteria group bacterium]
MIVTSKIVFDLGREVRNQAHTPEELEGLYHEKVALLRSYSASPERLLEFSLAIAPGFRLSEAIKLLYREAVAAGESTLDEFPQFFTKFKDLDLLKEEITNAEKLLGLDPGTIMSLVALTK